MHNLDALRANELLSEEQWRGLDTRAHWTARNFLRARRIVGLSPPQGFGVESVAFDINDEVSDADLNFSWPETIPADASTKERTTLPVPIIRKDLYIGRRKLAASRRTGQPLDTRSIDSGSYKVADKEDEFLYNGLDFDGDGTYEISGLYTGAGNDYSTTGDWGTASNIETGILGALALLYADKIPGPFNLTLNPTQYAQANALRTYTDRSYIDIVAGMIGGGLVLMASNQGAGTGLMSARPIAGWFDVGLTQDFVVERAETLARNLHVRIFEAMVPRIYDSNALCKLSSI